MDGWKEGRREEIKEGRIKEGKKAKENTNCQYQNQNDIITTGFIDIRNIMG